MRFTTLFLLLVWPWPHVESGKIQVEANGYATFVFKKPFKRVPTCKAWPENNTTLRMVGTPTLESVRYAGDPTAVLDVECR